MMPRDDGVAFELMSVTVWLTIFARPKSPTFTKPSPALPFCIMKILAGLRSRCRMPSSWAASTPSAICRSRSDGTLYRKRSFAAKQLVKRFALDIFHHEIEDAVRRLAKIGDADRVRMLDGSGGLRLAFEPGDRFAFLQILARTECPAEPFLRRRFCVSNFLSLAR